MEEKLSLQFILKRGEEVLTSATQEVSKDFKLLDFLNKTIPGLEETIHAFVQKVENEYKLVFEAPEAPKEETSN